MDMHVRINDNNGILEIIDRAHLRSFVLPSRKFVKNVTLEFYSNLNKAMFDMTSPDQLKGYIRG